MPDFAALMQTIAVYAIPVLLAITLHEASHAYAAKYFGDNTAQMLGRMSLNPTRHIDPIGTIAIPIGLLLASGGAMLFGYAKPVPIRVEYLRNPRRDMAWVALAGPASNFVMGFLWALLLIVILPAIGVNDNFFDRVCQAGISINLILFALNLLPIPPLDGGRIMVSLLPDSLAIPLSRIEPIGFFIILGLALFKLLHLWIAPWMSGSLHVFQFLLAPFH